MSDLDEVLLKLAKDKVTDLSEKDRIQLTDDLPIKKVAFDMYKVFGDQYDDLWRSEDINGESFLVRSSDPKYQTKEGGDWSASSNYDHNSVTLSYKNVPICAFSSDEYGYSSEDIFIFKSALLDMATDDSSFVSKVLDSQTQAKASAIRGLFPEIFKTN
jgi:hypothetical protein